MKTAIIAGNAAEAASAANHSLLAPDEWFFVSAPETLAGFCGDIAPNILLAGSWNKNPDAWKYLQVLTTMIRR